MGVFFVGFVFVVVVGVFFVGFVFVVVVGVFVVVVAHVVFIVVVGVFFVVVVAGLESVRDGVHAFGESEYRSAGLRHRFESVFQGLLQGQAVGHHQRRVLHTRPVLQRGLVTVRIAADRDDGLHLGQPVAGHIGNYVGPDAGGGQDRRGLSACTRRLGRGVSRASRRSQSRRGNHGDQHQPAVSG